MTNLLVNTGVTRKTRRFKVQIGDYSKYACKGYYTSPEFGNNDCESKWNLLVRVKDGVDDDNFIDVRLQRHDYVTDIQSVKVKTSIVNCFGYNDLENVTEILFVDSNEAQILAVAKKQLKGLEKKFYLPKDTLTLQCELSIHESNIPRRENDISDYFVHSRLVKKAEDYFAQKITDFSVLSNGDRIITPKFRFENLGGNWCFVVCKPFGYNNSSNFSVRLYRLESYEHQLAKVRLTITDPLNNKLLLNEKFVYFTSPKVVQWLPSTEVLSNWYEQRKKKLIGDDTLTLHCKIVFYEQIDDSFDRQKLFDSSVKTLGYAPSQSFTNLVAICFLLPAILYFFYRHCLPNILPFIWYTILPFIWVTILPFIFYTILIFLKIAAFAIVVIVFAIVCFIVYAEYVL